MTPNELIASYISDVDSPFHKLRYHTREHYGHLCKRIEQDLGDMPLELIKARQIKHWHEKFMTAGTWSYRSLSCGLEPLTASVCRKAAL